MSQGKVNATCAYSTSCGHCCWWIPDAVAFASLALVLGLCLCAARLKAAAPSDTQQERLKDALRSAKPASPPRSDSFTHAMRFRGIPATHRMSWRTNKRCRAEPVRKMGTLMFNLRQIEFLKRTRPRYQKQAGPLRAQRRGRRDREKKKTE